MINKLEEVILEKNLTIRQLSIKSHVSKTTISRLMNDKTANIKMETGLKICKALNVDPRDIFII